MVDPRKKIDELRIKNNLTLLQLARELGLSDTSVYNWYNEKNSMPTIKVLEDVCALFKIDMVELITDVQCGKLDARQIRISGLFQKLTERQKDGVLAIIEDIAALNKTE